MTLLADRTVPTTAARAGAPEAHVKPTRLRAGQVLSGAGFLVVAATTSLLIGAYDLPPLKVLEAVVSKLPLVHVHAGLGALGYNVLWQLRAPRVVLGGLVGAMLAVAGASYQGVFSNPLADPYLLGVASGAGLGATLAIVYGSVAASGALSLVPVAAFLGAVLAVGLTLLLARPKAYERSAASLVLAGVAVTAFFTAVQTFIQQQQSAGALANIYTWILGGLATSGWSQVMVVLPYVALAGGALFACRRLLDVLSLGDDEATSVGVRAARVRLVVVAAATLGTAAAVSVSGLIGFVGIIVPHTVRLLVGPSYRRIVPLSLLFGAGFLILADLLARTALSPQEVPLGVVTAFLGAPFFLVVLRRSRRFG